MKSSEPVFTRKNPFPPEPHLPRNHYNPSRAKKIPKQQKKLALSPVRYNQRASPPDSSSRTTSLSQEEQRFLEGSHHVVLCAPPAVKGQQIFSESWPSTDRCSSPTSTDASQPENTATSGTQEPSVLAKYIDRFRYGRPQSRSERHRLAADGADDQQFWWMSVSPPQPSSSTPTPASTECLRGEFDSKPYMLGEHQLNTSLSPTRGLPDLSVLTLSDTFHREPAEPEVFQLQERASRLLQKSEYSLSSGSSSVPISSEGLGSDFSSPVSVDEPIRRPMVVPSLMDTANLLTRPSICRKGLTVASSNLNSIGPQLRPEDDILFQWRLRRKMEQARQGSHVFTHNSPLHQPLLARLTLQPQPGLSLTSAPIEVTGSHVSPPAFEPLLPFSTKVHTETGIQTKHDCITLNQIVPSSPSTRETLEPQKTSSLLQPHLRKHLDSTESLIELCKKQQCFSNQHPHPSERPDEESHDKQEHGVIQPKGSKDVEKEEKRARPARQKKISARDDEGAERIQHTDKVRHRNDRIQSHVKTKETIKNNIGHRLDKSLGGGICSKEAPPPSPIHNTLGRVVSEVLFPGDDSPVQSRTTCPSINTSPEPSQSPAPLPQSHAAQPCEVIGQLMQEAEDSDGLEFADDPLLVVLRQQRQWVTEQLCELETMLDKLHKD